MKIGCTQAQVAACLICGLGLPAAYSQPGPATSVSQIPHVTANSLIVKLPTSKWIFQADGAPGINAPLSQVSALSSDRNGNIVFADPGNHVVERLNGDGTVAVLAGNGVQGFSGDNGPALSASLNRPSDAVMDSIGNLYILDQFNYRIRRVAPDGTIATIAGTGVDSDSDGSGPAIQASISGSTRLAMDSANSLYLSGVCQLRRITRDGNIGPFAGTGHCGSAADGGLALHADLTPQGGGLAFDSAGNLYFVEAGANLIRKIARDGILSTVAGNGAVGSPVDGPALSTPMDLPDSVAVDSAGNVFYSEVNNQVIREVTPDGMVSTFAGGVFGFAGDGGPATRAQFLFPAGLAFDSAGNLYIGDAGNFRIRRIQAGAVGTVAGNAQFRSVPDGTPAAQAYLYGPGSLSFDQAGNLLISEVSFHKLVRIRADDASFQVLAGTGAEGSGLEGGPANRALLDLPLQTAVDGQGNIYLDDGVASMVYRVAPEGRMSKFAGNNPFVMDYSGDNGPALQATFRGPNGIAIDSSENLFISDQGNNAIRRISPDGIVATYVGTGIAGFSGDNGPANAAQLSGPTGLAIDANGNLLICDTGNNRVRSVTPAGVISTLAGNGNAATSGDGAFAQQAAVNSPSAIAVDNQGAVYVIASGGRLLRVIDTAGTITTIAGNENTRAGLGDGGPAGKALLDSDGVAVDPNGNVFLSSFSGDSIRVVLNTEPDLRLVHGSFAEFSDMSVSLTAVSGGSPTAPQSFSVDGEFAGIVFNATSDVDWIHIPKPQAIVPASMTFAADPSKLQPGRYTGHIALSRIDALAPFATIAVTLNVVNALPPKLSVQPLTLSLSTAKGATLQPQIIHVLNTGSGTLNFQIIPMGFAAGSVQLSRKSGSVTAGTPVDVAVNIDPANLTPGTYTASLAIFNSGTIIPEIANVPLAISVASKPRRLALPQRGLLFTAVQGGGVTPAQSFAVVNAGDGSFDWTATVSTLGGSSRWLSVSPAAGTSTAGSISPSISVSVDPSSIFLPGVYYGLVRILAPDAADAPQVVEVVLNLLGPGQRPGPVVSRSGLVFVSPAGTSSPSSRIITVTNLNATPLAITPSANTLEGIPWLHVGPDAAQQQIGPGGNLRLTIAAKVDGLQPGAHRGTVLLQFPSPFPNLEVDVRLVITPSASGAAVAAGFSASPQAANCTATQLVPVFTSLLDNFTTPAAWPVALEATVVDDCGNALAAGQVVANFSNGDPPLSLVSLRDGRWQGTWFGGKIIGAKIKIALTADSAPPTVHGVQEYNGLLQSNDNVPAILPGTFLRSLDNTVQTTVGPGGIVSIQGSSFAAISSSSPQLPLTYALAGNTVELAGLSLPLLHTGSSSITAMVPYDVPTGQYSLVVSRGSALSGPEHVIVGAALPVVLRVTAAATSEMVQNLWAQIVAGKPLDPLSIPPQEPIKSGDQLTIYCTGLGAVSPPVDALQSAPSPGPRVVNTPELTIGGAIIPVSSAALVPGYVGIYAVQATMPSALKTGDLIPLTISVLGQSSSPVPLSAR